MERDFSELDRNYANTSVDGVELEFHPGFLNLQFFFFSLLTNDFLGIIVSSNH